MIGERRIAAMGVVDGAHVGIEENGIRVR